MLDTGKVLGSVLAVCLVIVLQVVAPAWADEARPARGPLFHPDGPGTFRWHAGVGAILDVVPREVVQDAPRQRPRAAVWARFGLPWRFSVGGLAATDQQKHEVRGSVAWSYRYRRVSIGLQDTFGLWWGQISNDDGTNVSARAFIHQPGLTAGFALNDRTLISVAGEAIYVGAQRTRIGTSETVARKGGMQIMGTAFTCIVENLVFGDQLVYFGAGFLRTLPNYEEWVSFSADRAKLVYPRFIAGYAF